MVGSTLIYYQRVPTDGARRLGCAGILDLCCRLPASGLSRPEARWPDKVLFSAEKSGALRAKAASRLWPAGREVGDRPKGIKSKRHSTLNICTVAFAMPYFRISILFYSPVSLKKIIALFIQNRRILLWRKTRRTLLIETICTIGI